VTLSLSRLLVLPPVQWWYPALGMSMFTILAMMAASNNNAMVTCSGTKKIIVDEKISRNVSRHVYGRCPDLHFEFWHPMRPTGTYCEGPRIR
jgi:hypothetical protein